MSFGMNTLSMAPKCNSHKGDFSSLEFHLDFTWISLESHLKRGG